MLNLYSVPVMTRCVFSHYVCFTKLTTIPQTDEDMFRALGSLFPAGVTTATMDPPLSAALTAGVEQSSLKPVQLAMPANGVFSTTVGASSKKTLARWHVTSPYAIVSSMLELLGDAPTAAEEPGEPDGKANL